MGHKARPRIRIGVWAGHVTASNPRGVGRVALGICSGLKSDGDVEYLALTGISYDFGMVSFECYPLESYLLPLLNAVNKKNAKPVHIEKKFIPATSVDSILSFECFEPIWGWPLRKFGIKSACVINDLIPFRIEEMASTDSKQAYFKALSNVVEKADKLLCISKATANDLRQFFPEAATKIDVIWLGGGRNIDPQASSSYIRQEADPRDTATILMVGTVERRKNFHSVLAAAPRIAEKIPNRRLRFVIAGDVAGPGDILGTRYQKILRRAQEVAEIIIPGYINEAELTKLYDSASAFVFPSLWEGFGFPILEAMMAGIPVVASDIPCHREVGGDHVRYCDPYDIENIADQIVQALAVNRNRRVWEVARGQVWAQRFTWQRTSAQCHYVLTELSQGNAHTSALDFGLDYRNIAYPTTQICEIRSGTFIVRLLDLIERTDLRHSIMMSVLAANPGAHHVMLALSEDDMKRFGEARILQETISCLASLSDASVRVILVGDAAGFSLRQLEVVRLLNRLDDPAAADQDLTASEVGAMMTQRASITCETLLLSDQVDIDGLGVDTIACSRLIVFGDDSLEQSHKIQAETVEYIRAGSLQAILASARTDEAKLKELYKHIFDQGSLLHAVQQAEQVAASKVGSGAATRAVSRLARALRMNEIEKSIERVILAYDLNACTDAQKIVSDIAREYSHILVLVGSSEVPDVTKEHEIVFANDEDSVELLIASAGEVIILLSADNPLLPPEAHIAYDLNKDVTIVGAPSDTYTIRAMGFRVVPDLRDALTARISLDNKFYYMSGTGLVLAASRSFDGHALPAGVDELSIRSLLDDAAIGRFKMRLDGLGLDLRGWADLAAFLRHTPPEAPIVVDGGETQQPTLIDRHASKGLRQILRGRPSLSAAHCITEGDALRDQKQWEAAAAQYRHALAINPRLAHIWVQYGHCLKEDGQLGNAERAYMHALSINPDEGDTYLQIGHLFKITGRRRHAERAYFTALVKDEAIFHARHELTMLGYSAEAIEFGVTVRRARQFTDFTLQPG